MLLNKKTLRAVILICALFFITCDNIFLPSTRTPQNITTLSNPRSTPEGVVNQLVLSYSNRRIELFKNLLQKNNFRFYIAAGLDKNIDNYINKYGSPQSELPDSFMHYVTMGRNYFYWGYDAEIESHTHLFNNTEIINVFSIPQITSINYTIDKDGDTSYAELKVDHFDFKVSTIEDNALVDYVISNQTQVFLLARDSNKLWFIKKWYDLGQ